LNGFLESLARQGRFRVLEAEEVLDELTLMLQHFELKETIFRSNHASNYLSLKGTLNQDKERILKALHEVGSKQFLLRSERLRRL
jgi:hypothetical protein